MATLVTGNYFGEYALLSDVVRNVTVWARTALDVPLIPKGDFNRLPQSVPGFGEVSRELARKRAKSVERNLWPFQAKRFRELRLAQCFSDILLGRSD